MIEIRWHGRAGQGAKTASQILALAALRAGRSVQAFPEYGPERSGAPMRAYTRLDDRPIRRRYGVAEPDVVVVLDLSLLADVDVADGLAADGTVLLNAVEVPAVLEAHHVVTVPGDEIASAGSGFVNVVMLGAAAAHVGLELEDVLGAARELWGDKAEANVDAIAAGYRTVAGERAHAA
jgi:pyruvate ferredoxin oxidoreductase gamma subunit